MRPQLKPLRWSSGAADLHLRTKNNNKKKQNNKH